MEGLIKGLIDVALGGGGHGEADDNHRQQHRRNGGQEEGEGGGQRDAHSRSSWADVVSSDGQGNDYPRPSHQHQWQGESGDQRPSPWGRSGDSSEWKGEPGGGSGDGDWEIAGGGRKKHQQQPRPHRKVPAGQWSGYRVPAGEQEYSPDVDGGVDVEPTQEELDDLSKACSRLWTLDLNGLTPGKDYKIDYMASGSLFSWVSDDVFRRPTYSRFCSLLDNYEPSQGRREVVTPEEKHEQDAFIEEISRTAPIKYLFKCLSGALKALWFDLYGRGGVSGSSSAFEHVFVGEIKEVGEAQVSGFHNWLQFYLEEAKGRVDYRGYIFPRRRGESPDEETKLLTIQFEWNGVLKSVSSSLIGVSPEFELALYTLCFYLGGEDNRVRLGPYAVNVKCYRHGGGDSDPPSLSLSAELAWSAPLKFS
ncbi:unnamed protein product [Spirodela intermedia]|uniref:EndoU domain-containing protein n=1 Tax=Spirodela intermedia TaxID=51605 RepID=A0A7I8JUI0_SPIIN|nr:unnamed protein product [Spirodela intermedia]CAA6673850.1 unnamed protein product [Spirodela intermedia]